MEVDFVQKKRFITVMLNYVSFQFNSELVST